MKKSELLKLNFFLVLLNTVKTDLSHLNHGFIHQVHSLYGPPPVIATTTESFLPEIIINRKTKDNVGYDYNRPQQSDYLPPANQYVPIEPPIQQFSDEHSEIPIQGPVPPQQDDPVIIQPVQGYLPPGMQTRQVKNGKHSDILLTYENSQNGYDYNIPTTQGPPSILIPSPAPGADVSVDIPNDIGQGYNYEVPFQDPPNQLPIAPQNEYLPPVSQGILIRHAKDFDQFTVNAKTPIRLHLKEMRCLNNNGGYFKAVFRLDSLIGSIPVVDNESTDSRCDLRFIQSHVVLNIASENFPFCGVKQCANNLCLRIRFPSIRGMKTESDSILTLQCKIQEKVVAKTHSFKMGISNDIQGRSLGAFAQGGNQQPFRTHLELLRKSPNGRTRHLEPHGAVQLGEELLLRAHVNSADGWNYTKLTDVNLQRLSASGEILNSANLISSLGCISPLMRSICPVPPSFDPPLGHRLSFKAVMFQDMRSGEEIVMSIKIAGCIERADCYVNNQLCNSQMGRLKRSLDKVGGNNTAEFEEISTISFRVIIPNGVDDSRKKENNIEENQVLLAVGGSIGIFCVITGVLVLSYFKFR